MVYIASAINRIPNQISSAKEPNVFSRHRKEEGSTVSQERRYSTPFHLSLDYASKGGSTRMVRFWYSRMDILPGRAMLPDESLARLQCRRIPHFLLAQTLREHGEM